MPNRPPAANVVKHQLYFRALNESLVTTIWTHHTAISGTDVRVDDERAVISDWLENNWRYTMPTAIRPDMIKSWDMSTVIPSAKNPEIYSPTLAGTQPWQMMPVSTGITISLRSQPVGAFVRGINGHILDSGNNTAQLASDPLQGSVWSAAIIAQRKAVYDTLLAQLAEGVGADARGSWVIMSYQLGGARGAPAFRQVPLVVPIDHIIVSNQLGIQRRRRPKKSSFPLGS